ncbi:8-amino-7-oxononanoate synthase [Halioxenophilus aromaticivorans]|uniref:8-amino-7-oxononanoate synthase n=1 Tax=Halioxenophilus aromaticivorans TaxID=1306992 RepID=A0AAV3U253_9ALTE
MIEQQLAQALQERQQAGLMRQRRQLETAQGASISVDGETLLGFASNDYLGLANHSSVVAAFTQAAKHYGVGSGASHLVNGHSREHHLLEEEIAAFTGRDRALLFSTGYMANFGTIMALLGQGDLVVEDKLNHASLLDGGLACGAKFRRYLHNDVASLEKTLALPGQRKLVVTDGVFSMDGDIAPLKEVVQSCRKNNAWLMVDDAHGIGVLGATGAGSLQYFGLSQQDVPILMGTLGKAAGGFGAFIAGSDVLIETLTQFARPYIYTTATPPAVAAANRAALEIIQHDSTRREHLAQLIAMFRAGAASLGVQLMDSFTAIQPVLLGSAQRTLSVAGTLQKQGILVGAIRPPTVPNGSARLRITLTANHSAEHIEQLLVALDFALKLHPATDLDNQGTA